MEGDPAGTKALADMCRMCAGSKGRALKMNVLSCLKHDNIFVFSELLQVESVRQMEGDAELGSTFDAIKLFAYGTYEDYRQNAEKFSFLKTHHISKLKKLTLLTLARGSQSLEYDVLQKALEIDSVRELEDLVIECMYLGVLKGKIDQRNRRIDVSFALGRDVLESEVAALVEKLQAWVRQSNQLSEGITHQIQEIQTHHEKERQHQEDLKGHVEALKMSLRDEPEHDGMMMMEGGHGGGGGGGGILAGLMGNMGRRGRKRKPGKGRDDMYDPRKR
eukprot:TRINITY_DN69_c0_g1_i1.p1 TRINITY_DN69_c0_g1~~TRINITY_DN69_c0_g1_i1.p1  ORF type:complete len:276 (-),score=121.04 TRINITY_DN69_c0_g1_i1:380-1207(-)